MNPYKINSERRLLTVNHLAEMKRQGEKIACLTAYDASFSALLDEAGIDVILVGDSLGMVIQGNSSTVPVTLDDMVYHSRCVTRGRRRAFVISDMPFMSYSTVEQALQSAARLMQQGGAQMVKLEGAHADIVSCLVAQGIPVCGHLGLLPQSINQLGRYKIQGTVSEMAEQMIQDALNIEQAGASLLVLECVPAALAQTITRQLEIPVIGIGAGLDCDGQVLVLYDILNIESGRKPKFFKDFMTGSASVLEAVKKYRQAVKKQTYPAPEHCY